MESNEEDRSSESDGSSEDFILGTESSSSDSDSPRPAKLPRLHTRNNTRRELNFETSNIIENVLQQNLLPGLTSAETSMLQEDTMPELVEPSQSPVLVVQEIIEQEIVASTSAETTLILHEVSLPELVDQVAVTLQTPIARILTRKRQTHKETWKVNIRKSRREKGEAYTNIKGKEMPSKSVSGSCLATCKLKCTDIFNEESQQELHSFFWKLSDAKKAHYLTQTVERWDCKRRKLDAASNTKKKFSYKYHFECGTVRSRVCKTFFLKTLNISDKRIYYTFDNVVDKTSGIPRSPKKGKIGSRKMSDDIIKKIKNHIDSFVRIESHYCRANTKKEYLDPTLSTTQMHKLFLVAYPELSSVKESFYRHIFNTQYNLAFYKPRKDQCDLCQEYKLRKDDDKIVKHRESKVLTRIERDSDISKIENGEYKETAVITFDLEKVFALPIANVSNFYYKRKLNCYNLTAHNSLNKKTYCAIWYESMAGRGANEIASCLYKILQSIIEDCPEAVNHIILWSDACVPQNKNSIMAMALKLFQEEYKVKLIEQKYCEPGHSSIQAIDAVHSVIESKLRHLQLFSPIGLVQAINSIPKSAKVELKVIQMQKSDFKNYKVASQNLYFKDVPFSKLKQINYELEKKFHLKYKMSFSGVVKEEKLVKGTPQRKKKTLHSSTPTMPVVKLDKKIVLLTKEKINDLKSMQKFFEGVDKVFYDALFKNHNK